ncbi:MAG: M15 family metallopeptidase [Spirosomataceae bacterium]
MLFRFLAACLLIASLGILQACGQTDSLAKPSWEDLGCDSTRRADTLTLYDLVVPFRLADSLRTRLVKSPKVYVIVTDEKGLRYWSATGGTIGGATQLLDLQPIADTLKKAYHNPDWLEQTYLWSLADSPTYLYTRWEPLLASSRQMFLARRDSLSNLYQRQFPKYELRISSDLRTASSQSAFLKKGASSVPLSHHQFGLASDVAIIYRKQYQRNYQLYKQFGDLTAQAGLHWGGNFVGFVDPPHVQLFLNSAEMVRAFPALRFEFEPYRPYYLKRVHQRIAEGKEELILDTEQLLTALNEIRRDQPCTCKQGKVTKNDIVFQKTLQGLGYQADTDIVIHGDIAQQTLTLVHPTRVSISRGLGRWR